MKNRSAKVRTLKKFAHVGLFAIHALKALFPSIEVKERKRSWRVADEGNAIPRKTSGTSSNGYNQTHPGLPSYIFLIPYIYKWIEKNLFSLPVLE